MLTKTFVIFFISVDIPMDTPLLNRREVPKFFDRREILKKKEPLIFSKNRRKRGGIHRDINSWVSVFFFHFEIGRKEGGGDFFKILKIQNLFFSVTKQFVVSICNGFSEICCCFKKFISFKWELHFCCV